MSSHMPFYKLYLQQELNRRCQSNSNYSMRSFARALHVDPAVLSRTLTDKRALSYKVAKRIIGHLSLSPQERGVFLESVAEDHKQRGLKKSNDDVMLAREPINEINEDLFQIIGDWYHYAIHQMTYLDNFDSDPRTIAKKLGLTVFETKQAIQRLLSTGLIREENGHYCPTADRIDTKNKAVSTSALRKHQKQMLQKAVISLESDPLERRSMTGMTMPVDPDKLPIARKMITQFMNQICDMLNSGKKKNVYQLSIALFPLEASEYAPKED